MSAKDRLNKHQVVADRRSLTQWISDACRSPSVRGYLYLVAAVIIAFVPLSTPIVMLALCPAFFSTRIPSVPLRLPMEANIIDRSDPKPAGDGFNKARGAVYIGNERFTNKEAWVSWNDQRLHDYVLGTTGSGKTETILAINANYVLAGSGFLIGDGKGTMMFPKQTTTLARLAGADDDSFVISFLSGYKDEFGRTPNKKSNLINPFGEGNAATVKELLTSLMSDGGGDNAIFADGAASLADSLSPAWVEGRDLGLFDFNITYIAQSLALTQVYELSQLKGLTPLTKQHITNYLLNLGYDFNKPPTDQPENCTRMHGYYVNYFMRVVTSFAISYRHIYLCKQGEVNMRDIVQSHRCLTFTLPSLEKSGDEVSNLGKTILVAAKAAASAGLGETMEGSREATVDKLPANYPIPYKFNFDEFSFYVMENFSLLPAQLRGINISCLMGAQDFIGTERAGEIDAESILANARTKFFGGLEDIKTWEKLRELVGEVDMAIFSRFQNLGTIGGRYVPDLELQHTRRCPLEIAELQEQVEGQFHVLQRGKVSKLNTYYPNINEETILDNYSLIRLVPSFKPTESAILRLKVQRDFIRILSQTNMLYQSPGLLKATVEIDNSESADKNAVLGLMAFGKKAKFSAKLLSTEDKKNAGKVVDISQPNPTPIDQNDLYGAQDLAKEVDVDIPSYSDTADIQSAHEKVIDEWSESLDDDFPDLTEPQSSDNEDDLLSETQASAVEYYQNDLSPSQEGVFGLTDRECEAIEKRYEMLGLLLGESKENAKGSAENIVQEMRKKVFYLIPPKPNAAKNIQEKVAALMKQADLFE